jgi:hypothetical protein
MLYYKVFLFTLSEGGSVSGRGGGMSASYKKHPRRVRCISNNVNLHFEGARFEVRLGFYLEQGTAASFQILFSSAFISHSVFIAAWYEILTASQSKQQRNRNSQHH